MVTFEEIQAAYYMVAATGVLVAAIYYIYNMKTSQKIMKTTLETRQMQMFMNVFDKFCDPAFSKSWNVIRNTQWNSFEEFHALWFDDKNSEFSDAMHRLAMFYEGLGVLVREGSVNIRNVALLMTGMTQQFWEKIRPVILEAREVEKSPRLMSEFEFLYDELMKYLGKHPELKT